MQKSRMQRGKIVVEDVVKRTKKKQREYTRSSIKVCFGNEKKMSLQQHYWVKLYEMKMESEVARGNI